jgi:hypothetical protein
MLSSIAIAAAMVGAVAASPAGYGYGGYPAESVVYSTSLVTVTSCGPEVADCPAKGYSTPAPYVPESTSTAAPYVPYTPESSSTPAPYVPYTTEAPVYSSPAPAYSSPAPVYSVPAYNSSAVPYVTKTVYSYSYYTSSDVVYTSTVDYYTTVCPETETPVYTPIDTPSKTEIYPVETSSICSESSTVTVVVPPYTPAPIPSGTGYIPYPSSSAIWGTASSSGYYAPSATYPAEFTGAASHANAGLAVAGLGAFAAFFL